MRDCNAFVQRWFKFLTTFVYTLEYRKGIANGNADFLSPLRNTTTVGQIVSPPWMMAVSSSSEPADFALVLHRPPVLAWVG